MVASRCPYRLPFRAAANSASTSEPVRYSRVRSTVEFTMVGVASLPACESMKNAPLKYRTVEQLVISSTVSTDETCMSQNGRGDVRSSVSLGRKPTLAVIRFGLKGHFLTHAAQHTEQRF